MPSTQETEANDNNTADDRDLPDLAVDVDCAGADVFWTAFSSSLKIIRMSPLSGCMPFSLALQTISSSPVRSSTQNNTP
jgi:hypothetical protein